MPTKDLSKMNLQMFAEGEKETDAGADKLDPEGGQEEVTFTDKQQEKMNEIIATRLSREKEKDSKHYQSQIDALKNEYDSKLETTVNEALKKSKLSDDELESYEQAEQRRKLEKAQTDLQAAKDQLAQENAELKARLNQQELKDKATQTLKEKGVEPTDFNLKLVLRDDAENTLEAIEWLASSLSEQKNVLEQSEPPKTSGGFANNDDPKEKSIFDSAKITNY